VYGGLTEYPFSEKQNINQPVSLYAATKASNELVAKSYSHLFKVPTTGLRFFTVYGPFSRPDMALYKFARLMQRSEPIPVFNGGRMVRDFTFVDDIVDGIIGALNKPQLGAVYNLGRGEPMELMEMIRLLEQELGIEAKKDMLPMQMGDVPKTVADVSKARKDLGYVPKVSLKEGIARFSAWFKEHAKSDIFE
jgi:UDP-glucuronate 4-epimerase